MLKAPMLRKTLIIITTSLSLFLSSFSLASSPFHGFYIGAEFGRMGAGFNTRIQANFVNPFPGLLINIGQSNDGSTGFIGSLALGYALLLHRFYLAGEVLGSIYTLSFNNGEQSTDPTTIETVGNIKFIRGYGVNLKPGVLLSQQLLLYGLIGFVSTLQQFHFNILPVFNGKFHREATRFGLGLSLALTHHLAFQMQYVIINYQTLNRAGTTDAIPGIVIFADAQIAAHTYEATGALVFYFN